MFETYEVITFCLSLSLFLYMTKALAFWVVRHFKKTRGPSIMARYYNHNR